MLAVACERLWLDPKEELWLRAGGGCELPNGLLLLPVLPAAPKLPKEFCKAKGLDAGGTAVTSAGVTVVGIEEEKEMVPLPPKEWVGAAGPKGNADVTDAPLPRPEPMPGAKPEPKGLLGPGFGAGREKEEVDEDDGRLLPKGPEEEVDGVKAVLPPKGFAGAVAADPKGPAEVVGVAADTPKGLLRSELDPALVKDRGGDGPSGVGAVTSKVLAVAEAVVEAAGTPKGLAIAADSAGLAEKVEEEPNGLLLLPVVVVVVVAEVVDVVETESLSEASEELETVAGTVEVT